MKFTDYDQMTSRAVEYAQYIIDNNTTVRDCAYVYNCNKSTVCYVINKYLRMVRPDLYETYKMLAAEHFKYKYEKGAAATKEVWNRRKNNEKA